MNNLAIIVASVVLAIGLVVGLGSMNDGIGAVPGVNLVPNTELENVIQLSDGVAANTLIANQSGSIVYTSASSSITTLPATRAGLVFTFAIDEAVEAGNWVIASAEGDNINGTLSVNNADVDCSGEDQLTFVTDGEVIGDNVTLRSDGTQWLIVDSNVATAAKLTCTDPS